MRLCYNGSMRKNTNKWSSEDRQRFADRNILRAQSVPSKRFGGAEAEEWDYEDEDAEDYWD